MRQIYPVHGPDLPLAARASAGPLPDGVADLVRLYGTGGDTTVDGPLRRRWVRANMVASADGAAALNGRSRGLSGAADRMVFTVLRSVADLILVGAGTARTERYRPVQADEIWTQLRPRGAPLPAVAVVTRTLNLAGCDRLLTEPRGRSQTIVITTVRAPAERRAAIAAHARVIEAGEQHVDLAAAIGALSDLGYANILTEGGPRLLAHLARAGLLDELCLTTSPLLAGAGAGPILAGELSEAVQLTLAHVLADGDFLLCRYLVGAGIVPG